MSAPYPPDESPFIRLIQRAVDVKSEEVRALGWSCAYFFFILSAYYIIRPMREEVGVAGGVRNLPWLFTGTLTAMLLVHPPFAALVARFPRRTFVPFANRFFAANLVIFHVLLRTIPPENAIWAGRVFFVWTSVFNLFVVSVFWSFMADIYTDIEARRLYGFIAAGGTAGGFLGPLITRGLVNQIGVPNLLLVSASLLAVCVFCILRLGEWARLREQSRGQVGAEQAMGGSMLAGLRLLRDEPLLRAMAVVMFFGVGVGTLLYNEQAAIARAFYPGDEARTAYYANIDLAINLVTILVQVFLTRPLLVRYGVGPVLLIPVVAILIGFAALTASPLPLLVAMVQVATRAGEFSLAKPARETIYTRVDRETRYKGKAVIDTAVYRFGDLFFAWVHKFLALFGSVVVFGGGMLIAAGLTFGAWRLIREQAKLPADPR